MILIIFLEQTESKEEQSPAEIALVSQMDCSSSISLNMVTSMEPEPCPTDQNIASPGNPLLDLAEIVPATSRGKN